MFTQSVDVIVADLGEVVVDEDLLSLPELGRALQFGSPASLAEYLAVHTWLRRRLAEYLDFPAADLRFGRDEHGKPIIVEPQTDLSFNLAYSGGMAALAVGFRSDIGIDVERIKGSAPNDSGMGRVFSSRDKISAIVAEEMETAYLRRWVRNQALGKATGHGLDGYAAAIDLSGESPVSAGSCEVSDLNLGPGYVAAVAVPAGSTVAMSIVVSELASVEAADLEQELDFPHLFMAGVGN